MCVRKGELECNLLFLIISLYLYNQVRGLVTLREKWKASSVTLRFSEGTFTPVIFLSVLPHIHDSGSVDFLTFLSLFFSSFLPLLSTRDYSVVSFF